MLNLSSDRLADLLWSIRKNVQRLNIFEHFCIVVDGYDVITKVIGKFHFFTELMITYLNFQQDIFIGFH